MGLEVDGVVVGHVGSLPVLLGIAAPEVPGRRAGNWLAFLR
jgi:hypothetical protein